MPNCPLIGKPCEMESCAWYAGGIRQCSMVAMAMMLEHMHDVSIFAYEKYVKEEAPQQ